MFPPICFFDNSENFTSAIDVLYIYSLFSQLMIIFFILFSKRFVFAFFDRCSRIRINFIDALITRICKFFYIRMDNNPTLFQYSKIMNTTFSAFNSHYTQSYRTNNKLSFYSMSFFLPE